MGTLGSGNFVAPTPLKVTFIKEIGTRVYLRQYWGENCGTMGCHNAMLKLNDIRHNIVMGGTREHHGGKPADYPEEVWPKVCEDCGAIAPPDANRQVFNHRLYDSPTGRPERGNIWYADWMPLTWYWDDKKDWNLIAMCPDGYEWNIDSRASNCTMKEDRQHRCWTRSGDPETGNIDVSKNYYKSCQAGAGSILTHSGWHGFLRQGFFVM